MRTEIKNVVSMVLGFADKVGWSHTVNLSDGDLDWEFRVRLGDQMQVQCWSRAEARLIYFFRPPPFAVQLRMENVMKVHRGLPLFVDGMAKTIPALAEKWQPLLDAADD
ncbi:MAG: hypothetical protein WAP55_01850 [Minisyncoccia bacterium]